MILIIFREPRDLKKSKLKKLIVDDLSSDDSSAIYLSNSTLQELGLFRSDSILVKGKRRHETAVIVLGTEECEDNKVKMNKGSFVNFFSR